MFGIAIDDAAFIVVVDFQLKQIADIQDLISDPDAKSKFIVKLF